jgi:hypothetical protein
MSTLGMGAIKWRETGRALRFAGVDGRALFLLCIFVYHPRWWTLGLFFVGIVALVLLERMGYSIPNAMRRLRVIMVGRRRPAVTITRLGRSDR